MPATRRPVEVVAPSQLERRVFAAGLALITAHLLDRAFAGAQTSAPAVALIIAVPVALALAHGRLGRATRVALAGALGVLVTGVGGMSDVLHVFTSGPAWTDVTGWLFTAGGVALVASAVLALRGPHEPAGRHRVLRGAGWLLGAALVAQFVLLPLYGALYALHAPRLPVGSLDLRHVDVTLTTAGGDRLAASYVPSRNRAAVVLIHGASGNRSGVADHARLLARHGYGVLLLDLPGHGESGGRAHMLGWTSQPAVDAALRFLRGQPDVDPRRIAGFGTSLGGEVLLEAAARSGRLRAVVADGAGSRSLGESRLIDQGLVERAVTRTSMQLVRGIGGVRPPVALDRLVPRIAPRPVLLMAAGGAAHEVDLNRIYRSRAGASATLWELPGVGHTKGIHAQPAEYERRTIAFLDGALLH